MDHRPPGLSVEVDKDSAADCGAPDSIDPATVALIRKALANPRPPSPAAVAFARADARIAGYKAKRGI